MGSELSNEKKDSLLIICPECFIHIPLFKIKPPFIFFWCECFRDHKEAKLFKIYQYKKITYINYIQSLKEVNFDKLDLNKFSEITNCEAHPDKKEVFIGLNSLEIRCENCKNPGENNIPLEEFYINEKNKIIKNIQLDIIKILEDENYLICEIYRILIKEIEQYKLISPNINKSLDILTNLIINNNDKNRLYEISEQIKKYIPKKEKNEHKFKLNKTSILINLEQTLSDRQTYAKKIEKRKVYSIIIYNEEEKKDDIINNNYSVIMLYALGNISRGDMRCSISKFSLFPFKEKIKYKNNSKYTFSNPDMSLSKYFKNKFICLGNSVDFAIFDYILIYSINSVSPITTIEIKDKYILLKSIFLTPNDKISFLYLSQDKEDKNFPGQEESGHRYIYFYNHEGNILYKENINKIFHGNDHYCIKTLCEYIKNKKIIVFLFQFASFNKQLKNRSYLLFYNLNEKKYKLLTHENLSFLEKDKKIEFYILSIYCNDDYLFCLNTENIIQKWDCQHSFCMEKININFNITNGYDLLNLISVNNNFNKLIIINIGDICYYNKNGDSFVESLKIKFEDNDKKFSSFGKIDFEKKNDDFIIFKNKNFYIIKNI